MVSGHESVVYFDVTLNPACYIDDVRPRDGIISPSAVNRAHRIDHSTYSKRRLSDFFSPFGLVLI